MFKFKRGDQFSTTITIKDSSGNGIDITWATVFFIIRSESEPNDTDDSWAILTKDITSHTTPASGITTLTLTSTDTNKTPWEYHWEIQVKFSNWDIISANTAKLLIEQDLNKRTS